ncbi:RNA polymerase sigma factor [Pseudomonas orientalis]|uniref:RNA polymerase sigma factor n=1 Tax=Pseudomonas orientalis TaxID=76758 RepID=UPI000F06306C
MSATVNALDVFVEIRDSIFRIALHRTGTIHGAQDVTQDICLKVMSLANEFETYDDARNYLIRIAINASTDALRSERRRLKLLEGAATLFMGYSSSPENDCKNAQIITLLGQALNELPPKCRDILYLSRIEGMTHSEIAIKLNVSRSLVEKYTVRAILHCREFLKKINDEKEGN